MKKFFMCFFLFTYKSAFDQFMKLILQILIIFFRCFVLLGFKRLLSFECGKSAFLLTSDEDSIIDVAAGVAVLP